MRSRLSIVIGVVAVLLPLLLPMAARAQTYPPPLTDTDVDRVRRAFQSMREDPRGPYLRIRWFCADGTVQPPQGRACAERGGGVQHAERNDLARQLDALHIHVGTILQATPREDLFDAGRNHYRLTELVLQQYLVEIDDGWVLRRARYYRGARQIEDEEARGQEFLEWLLAQRDWVRSNYFLAARVVATLPHPTSGTDRLTERIRNLATEVATLDSTLQALRVKIHSYPSADDLATVDARLGASGVRPEVRDKLLELREELRRRYDTRLAAAALAPYERRLDRATAAELTAVRRAIEGNEHEAAFRGIGGLLPKLRDQVTAGTSGARALVTMDLIQVLHDQAFVLADEAEASGRGRTRAERARGLKAYFAIAYGAGYLSARERAALDAEADRVASANALSALAYRASVSYMARSLEWSWGTVRSTFGLTHQRYLQVEPKAVGFLDAVVRGSLLLPLSSAVGRLAEDADRALGASHEILGVEISHGARGLNAGVALRVLEVVEPDRTDVHFDPSRIYVVPATTSELRPVAGVLTLDEGNLLSHVQLLARNLGIPNAALSPTLLARLRGANGREIFFAVSPMGRVVLKEVATLSASERALVTQGREARQDRVRLDTSRLRLGVTTPISLTDLRASHSGVVVGPKAANLGQLGAYFPGRVSPGVALPFGMFQQHVNRPFGGSNRTMLEELESAYQQAEAMREAGRPEAEIDEFMFGTLARFRQGIMELAWLPETRAAIERAIRETFGADVTGGVFVRSDTNVEDLPQFSGAGLNLTVPHVTSVEGALQAVRRVWTSPFSERAYLWRKQILLDQGRVYPSVLLLASIHSDKSGVLITSGLQLGDAADFTIAVAEGVGGAVDGEDAETVIVTSNGSLRLLSQAKAPLRRRLEASGGATMVAARRPETLLLPDEIRQLQAVVAEWRTRFAPGDASTIWDIEFGFVDGRLWLFQIRPFVRFRSSDLMDRLAVLDRPALRNANRPVRMQEVP